MIINMVMDNQQIITYINNYYIRKKIIKESAIILNKIFSIYFFLIIERQRTSPN